MNICSRLGQYEHAWPDIPRKIYLVCGSIARANNSLRLRGAITGNFCAIADSKTHVRAEKISFLNNCLVVLLLMNAGCNQTLPYS